MSDIRKYFQIKSAIPNKDNDNDNDVKQCVNVFTDGSSINNGKKNIYHSGGIGVYIEDTKEEISEKVVGKITNNICELKACILRESKSILNVK